ncbi:2-dehydropantoate 2-reductase [Micromonospora terminaliae]|uniref:2-dehydropantoate 2-reductase n=1 Tax=Micromonospora terminaliae TaxID=1914461 RepID=A0AAJ2Z9T8_9ACTN|nr:ketopantoate reductase family protein [Micromonospora terminaliae]NES26020.1 ketopantoate reductase family protein [Micromonospora terminaliae]QGL50225.1 2-dehydropantoate 2-reductase [Micromonospora terminaliae]
MRILVVGAGATGGYFGAQLQQAGRDVTFLVRPRRADVLRERGLRITGLGTATVLTPRLLTAAEIDGRYDIVLVSVKATALPAAIEDVAAAVGPGTTVIPFLNGMAHMDALTERFGVDAVLGGVVRVLTTLDAEGDIVRLGALAEIVIGEQQGGPSPRVEQIAEVLSGAGFDFSVSPDIRRAMWHKWVFISTLAALNTLVRGSVGDATATPGGDRLGPQIAAEAAAVSAAAGYPLPQQALDGVQAFVTRPGSADTASLYRDLVAGQPTEVEQIFGDLTARARTLGVPTPLLDATTVALRVHERRLTGE